MIPYSGLNSFFFLLDLDLKIHTMIKIVQQCETSSAEAFSASSFDEEDGEDGEKESDETEEDGRVQWGFVSFCSQQAAEQRTAGENTPSSIFISVQKNNVGKLFQTTINSFFFSLSLLLKKYSIKETNPTIITVYTAILSACLGEYKCGDQTLVESEKKTKKTAERNSECHRRELF